MTLRYEKLIHIFTLPSGTAGYTVDKTSIDVLKIIDLNLLPELRILYDPLQNQRRNRTDT